MTGQEAVKGRVLVTGIYLHDKENTAEEIVESLAQSQNWSVEQRWIALGQGKPPAKLASVTAWHNTEREAKFILLNRLLAQVQHEDYDFIIVTDDDILLPEGFLDNYLAWVEHCDFALSQPARTHNSYIDHYFVDCLDGLKARQTRFVEIGPLFAMRRDAYATLLPFDEATPMGWGYCFTWVGALERRSKKAGIVDATPVDHSLRKPVTHYSHDEARQAMERYLASRSHYSKAEAFFIVESFT